jgi:tetraacyldisaccharide 4'-kinase
LIAMRAVLERKLNQIWYGPERPGAGLVMLSALHRRVLGRRWRHPTSRPDQPVIVVGNLTVGGGGKTPVVIALARHLHSTGHRVAVISRGYGGRRHARPIRVGPDSHPADCGDEPVLIARSVEVPVWICVDRAEALAAACANGAEVVIADDGLQHRGLARSLEICVIDGQRGLGNGRLLPAGPLRQPAARMAEVDQVLVKGAGFEAPDALRYELVAEALTRLDGSDPLPPAHWAGQVVDAVCGIANPASFFASLEALGLELRRHPWPDHHRFSTADFARLAGPVVVTAKDAVKLRDLPIEPRLRVLTVRAELPAALLRRVEQHLLDFQA